MEKHFFFMFMFAIVCVMFYTTAFAKEPSSCEKKAKGPSTFQFYMHNTVYNPSVNNTSTFTSLYGQTPNLGVPNPLFFGTMSTFEDPLTQGASNTSAQIGRAQGIWVFDGLKDFTLFHLFTANITKGEYKGTLSIFGQIREIDPVRYLTVIGGTGDFLGAHGLAKNTLIEIDHTAPAKWTLFFDLDLYY